MKHLKYGVKKLLTKTKCDIVKHMKEAEITRLDDAVVAVLIHTIRLACSSLASHVYYEALKTSGYGSF